ncbi:hypothetical protein OESDEN_08110 [Oesophagostomum dentatum]|uniref:Uncharacterized protein n=1 Tax=Oesophagostomum dentatum TaxID=61180 RepID=A0A0B1T449_OESDE|nr:hypothetical protein OESDEN_08110 [Oesophagostomum dentatum]
MYVQVGCLVEVQDAEQRAAIFPGHVSEIINSHFVKIVSSSYGQTDTREVSISTNIIALAFISETVHDSKCPFCLLKKRHIFQVVAHRGTHGVFPQGFCASVGYQLSLPQKFLLKDRNLSEFPWSWKSYAAEWGIPGVNIPTNEYCFEPIPGKEAKIAPMRHVEDEDVSYRKRSTKVATVKRRRTQQPFPLPKDPAQHPSRSALTSDDDFSRSSVDEMPRLHRADPVECVPNGSAHGEETSNHCSSSDETQTNPNGISRNNSSPQRPLRIEGDVMEWETTRLMQFLRVTFPDLNDVTNVLEREHIDGAHLLTMSQQDCIDSLGLNLGPALRLYEVIQEIKNANETHS